MSSQYIKWVYYCAGIFIGFYNGIAIPFEEPTILHGAAIAVATLIIFWTLTWILTGFTIKRMKP